VRFSTQRDGQEKNLVATKNIKNHQELFVDYGDEYKFNEIGTRYIAVIAQITQNIKYSLLDINGLG
jgi:hypothetical protein